MNLQQAIDALAEKKWSGDVKTSWSPPEGLFTKSGKDIAAALLRASDSPGQAMQRLSYYMNRAGSKLPAERKAALSRAKEIIHSKVEKKESIQEQVHKGERAIAWLEKKCRPMVFSDGSIQPLSGYFSGNLPYRMVQDILSYAEAVGAKYRDAGSRAYYNWSVPHSSGYKKHYAFSRGTYKSTSTRVTFSWQVDMPGEELEKYREAKESMTDRERIEETINKMVVDEVTYPKGAAPAKWSGTAKKWASAYLYSWGYGFGPSGMPFQHPVPVTIKPGMTYEQALLKAIDENGQDPREKKDYWLVLMLDADPKWLTT